MTVPDISQIVFIVLLVTPPLLISAFWIYQRLGRLSERRILFEVDELRDTAQSMIRTSERSEVLGPEYMQSMMEELLARTEE